MSPKCVASRTGFDDKRFAISVNEPERVIILGHSKDYARCKATRKDGRPCTKAVNATKCGYCEFHIASRFKFAKSKRGFSSGASARPTQKKIVPSKPSGVHLSRNGVYTMKNNRHGISFRVERQGQVRGVRARSTRIVLSYPSNETNSTLECYEILISRFALEHRYVFKPQNNKNC